MTRLWLVIFLKLYTPTSSATALSGLYGFSLTSRICHSYTTSYTRRILRSQLIERLNLQLWCQKSATIHLNALEDSRLLQIEAEVSNRAGSNIHNSESVLSHDTFETLEYYKLSPRKTSSDGDWFWPSPRMLDILNILCPSLSRITIGSTSDALNHHEVCWCAPERSVQAWHSICAMSRFHNLRHVEVHVDIDEFRLGYMNSTLGIQVTNETYQFIQQRKCGRPLLTFTFVLWTFTPNLFGYAIPDLKMSGMERLSMTCAAGGGYNTDHEPVSTCSDPSLGKILESRKRAAERGGMLAWEHHIGPYLWKKRQGKIFLPSLRQLEWYIRMALPPGFSTYRSCRNFLPEQSIGSIRPPTFWHVSSGILVPSVFCYCPPGARGACSCQYRHPLRTGCKLGPGSLLNALLS